MTLMKKILIPIDFSELSMYAIKAGAELAFQVDAELILFHAIEDEEDPTTLRKKLDPIFNMKEVRAVTYQYRQELGEAVEEVTKERVDLIVMASRGAKGLKSLFVGTHAEKIAKNATCPVFIIKGETDLTNIKSILFPTNMLKEDEQIIRDVKSLQTFYNASLHVMKAFDDTLMVRAEVEKRMQEFAEFHQMKNYTVSAREGIDQAEVILKFADEIDCDLIVMATHDRHGLDKILSGHVSGHVINESKRPLWVKSLKVAE